MEKQLTNKQIYIGSVVVVSAGFGVLWGVTKVANAGLIWLFSHLPHTGGGH